MNLPAAEAGKVQEHLDPSAKLSQDPKTGFGFGSLVFLTPPNILQDWESILYFSSHPINLQGLVKGKCPTLWSLHIAPGWLLRVIPDWFG